MFSDTARPVSPVEAPLGKCGTETAGAGPGACPARLDPERRGPSWRLFFELLASSGLRIGEALELRWSDVDFGARRLHVQRQVDKDGLVSPPKTRTGRRVVPLSMSVCRRLWRRQRAADELLFVSPRGLHVDRRWLRRFILDPAAEAAGVPWVTFHTFRHTCASLLFAQGKTLKQVQMWLGHTDPAFTLRVYVHLLDDGLGEALDETAWGGSGVALDDLGETRLSIAR